MTYFNSLWTIETSSSDLSTATNGSFYFDDPSDTLYLTDVDSLGRNFFTFASDNDGTTLNIGAGWDTGFSVIFIQALKTETLTYTTPTSWTITKGINSFSIAPVGLSATNSTRFNTARGFSFDFASGPIEADGTTTWDTTNLPASLALTESTHTIEQGTPISIFFAGTTTVINEPASGGGGPARGDYGQLYPRC